MTWSLKECPISEQISPPDDYMVNFRIKGDMPKKFKGENSKAAEARARKSAAREQAEAAKQKAIKDEYWRDDDKHAAKKQARKVSVFNIIFWLVADRYCTHYKSTVQPYSSQILLLFEQYRALQTWWHEEEKNSWKFNTAIGGHISTRMHSSRMRTIHCSRRLLGGCLPGGVCPSACWDTPPCEQNDRQV